MRRWRFAIFFGLAAAIAIIVLTDPHWSAIWPAVGRRTPVLVRHGGWPLRNALYQTRLGATIAHVGSLVSQFLMGSLVLLAIPSRIRRVARAFTLSGRGILRNLAIGLLLAIVLVAGGLLAVLSPHTFPLSFILLGILFLASLAGAVALTYQLGQSLLGRAGWGDLHPLMALGLGTVIVFTLTRIPYAGGFFLIIIWLAGTGAMVATHFGSGKAWSLAPLMENEE